MLPARLVIGKNTWCTSVITNDLLIQKDSWCLSGNMQFVIVRELSAHKFHLDMHAQPAALPFQGHKRKNQLH